MGEAELGGQEQRRAGRQSCGGSQRLGLGGGGLPEAEGGLASGSRERWGTDSSGLAKDKATRQKRGAYVAVTMARQGSAFSRGVAPDGPVGGEPVHGVALPRQDTARGRSRPLARAPITGRYIDGMVTCSSLPGNVTR